MSFTRVVEFEDEFSIVHSASWLGWLCLVLFGVPGLFALVMALRLGENPAVQPGGVVPLAVLGVVVTAMGLGVFTMAQMTIVDRAAGTVRGGWSVFGFFRAQRWSLSAFHGIAIREGTRSAGNARVARYYVHLVGMTAERVRVVYLAEYADAESACDLARRLGAFTGLPVFEE